MHACLGDVDDGQDGVDGTAPGEVESVVPGLAVTFAGGDRDGLGSAPAGEMRLGRESPRVADFGEQGDGRHDADDVGPGGSKIDQQCRQRAVDLLALGVDPLDRCQRRGEPSDAGLFCAILVLGQQGWQSRERGDDAAGPCQLIAHAYRQRAKHRLGFGQVPDPLQVEGFPSRAHHF